MKPTFIIAVDSERGLALVKGPAGFRVRRPPQAEWPCGRISNGV